MLRTLLLAVLSAAALAAIPSAASAATCKLPADGEGLGPTYLLSLKTSGGASCATGKAVVKAWHACATAKSAKGRCTKKVLGFSLHREAGRRDRHAVRRQDELPQARRPRRVRLHPVHLKSAASARCTASAASCAPASSRWIPSGSRTTVSRPSTSMLTR